MRNGIVSPWGACALVSAFAVAACDDSPTDPPQPEFMLTGEIAGQGDFEDFSASADAEVFLGSTDITLELENVPGEAEDGLPWTFREGTCEDSGDALGEPDDYPAIEAQEDGTWSGTALVAPDEDEGSVVLDIYLEGDQDGNGDAVPVACGELEAYDDD